MLEIEQKLMDTVGRVFPNIKWTFQGGDRFGYVQSDEFIDRFMIRFTLHDNSQPIDRKSNGTIWFRKSLIYEVVEPSEEYIEGVSLELACESVQAKMIEISQTFSTIASSIKEVK